MRNIFRVIFIIVIMFAISIGAYSNGLNLNGMGTKAISMGGAFIALSDDYSAVFWNPAGLTQMDKASFSVFSSFIIPTGTYKYDPAGIDIKTESQTFPAPAITYYKPISEKLVIGFTFYATAGAGATWNGASLVPFNTGFPLNKKVYKWESQVGALTFSPVVAFKVSDKFSIGATLNVTYGFLKMNKEAKTAQYTEDVNGVGFGATFGAMFKPSDKFSIGFTFKTPQKISLSGDLSMTGLSKVIPVPGFPEKSAVTRDITWPLWAGVGIAFKPTDKLTIAFDAQYTKWSELDEIPVTADEKMWNVNLGAGTIATGATYELKWDDAIQYRVGFEYKLSDTIALRGGYYYDPAPAPDTTLNILLPSITYNVFTFGLGYNTDKIVLDVGMEYLKGADRDADMKGVLAGTAMPGTHGMSMIVPSIGFTYKF